MEEKRKILATAKFVVEWLNVPNAVYWRTNALEKIRQSVPGTVCILKNR